MHFAIIFLIRQGSILGANRPSGHAEAYRFFSPSIDEFCALQHRSLS
jgi:hypothetical protein